MPILILFAFLGGIVTILSPCILPILPIVLSGSVTGGKKRPFGVVTGFIVSFTLFTLFLTALVKATGISPNLLRMIAVLIIAVFGLSLIIPKLQLAMERIFSRLANAGPKNQIGDGFVSGILVGISLGLVWTPCVGPILASIIALAATQSVGFNAVVITLFYALGTSIPLLAITAGGRSLLKKIPDTRTIQKLFGALMIATAAAIFFSWDVQFQTYILKKFPSYGTGLTNIENNSAVQNALHILHPSSEGGSMLGNIFDQGYGMAPDFIAGGKWFNSKPLSIKDLRSKVVIVDFWTYTCINCIRTLPYLTSWYNKYKDKGLIIVGVHTPEFAFEHDANNVADAIKRFHITYPVMQDNDYATWNAYTNQYWPAEYFIDKTGKIRFTHFGEGNYDESEHHIQELLGISMPVHNPAYSVDARSPETYLGAARGDYSNIETAGIFNQTDEYTQPTAGATLMYHFNAKDVYLVMRPKTNGVPAKMRILIDGKDPGVNAGSDAKNGAVTVDSDRLYTLVSLQTSGAHTLTIEFLDENAELFAFTFG